MNKKTKAIYLKALRNRRPFDWSAAELCTPWKPTLHQEAVEMGLHHIDHMSRRQLLKRVRRARKTFCIWDDVDRQIEKDLREIIDNLLVTNGFCAIRWSEEPV